MNRKRKLPPVAAQYQGYRVRGTVGRYYIYVGKNLYTDHRYNTIEDALTNIKSIQT